MKKDRSFVAIIFTHEAPASSRKYSGFATRLQQAGFEDYDVLTCALENLAFIIREDMTAEVIDTASGMSLSAATFVYLKSWEKMAEEGSALAQFLQGRNVPFADTLAVGVGFSKIANAMRLWKHGISQPETLYIRNSTQLLAYIKKTQWQHGKQFVAKDIFGQKGRLNFLVDTEGLEEVVRTYPDVHFVCQRYVPNDGDYRIGVYDSQTQFAMKRYGSGANHTHNTSQGGKAVYVPLQKLPLALKKLAKNAAAAVDMQIAGVDIIIDQYTSQLYVLEVNQGSQIVTGAHVEQKTNAFITALQAMILRGEAQRDESLQVIGRRAFAQLPTLKVSHVIAKVDTGAYSSTLHAENIRLEKRDDGMPELVFDIVPLQDLQTIGNQTQSIRTTEFSILRVRSSNGHVQERYGIQTPLCIGGKVVNAMLSLSDRTEMGYPLLIGRKVIRSRFLVNVDLDEMHTISG